MRKLIFLLTFACLLPFLSCTGDKQAGNQEAAPAEPRFQVSAKDTSDVLMMTSKFLGHLKTEQYDSAVAMLYVFNGDTLKAISGERAATQKALLKRFHGIRYQLESLQLNSEFDNEVNYVITLFDNNPGEHHANTIRGALNPVRIGGKWYLTAKDSKTAPRL